MDMVVYSLWALAFAVVWVINIWRIERNSRVLHRLENALLAQEVADKLEESAAALARPSAKKALVEVVSPKPLPNHSPSSERTVVETHSPRPIAVASPWVKLPYCGADFDEPIAEKDKADNHTLTRITPLPPGVHFKDPMLAHDEPVISCKELAVMEGDVDDADAADFFDAMAFVEASRQAGFCGEEEEQDSGDRKTRELGRPRDGQPLELHQQQLSALS